MAFMHKEKSPAFGSWLFISYLLGIGRVAPLASPIRFDPLAFIHGPYPIPRYPIDP